MASVRQAILAENIVKNAKRKKPLNKKELVISSGYSLRSGSQKSTTIINSKGTQKELKNLGFTEEGAKQVVQEILYDKKVRPETRLTASKQVFEVLGSFAPDKHINLNTTAEELRNLIQND